MLAPNCQSLPTLASRARTLAHSPLLDGHAVTGELVIRGEAGRVGRLGRLAGVDLLPVSVARVPVGGISVARPASLIRLRRFPILRPPSSTPQAALLPISDTAAPTSNKFRRHHALPRDDTNLEGVEAARQLPSNPMPTHRLPLASRVYMRCMASDAFGCASKLRR